MKYSKRLRQHFDGITLKPGDLLLLESFQVKYLPERVPHKEFAALIRKYPFVKDFLISKNSSVVDFIDAVLKTNKEISDEKLVEEYCDETLWEIADLIVYNKYPGVYDEKTKFSWSIDEIISREFLAGKTVADVGAGSGTLAFLLAQFAETVYAIEPISSFRTFIRQKAVKENCSNVYALDGFLDAIPFPANTFDILFTSNAIGWSIETELQEIERLVKPGGQAIHILRVRKDIAENPVHDKLVSGEWEYTYQKLEDETGLKLKYHKTIS